jgi:hypothetical protein
MHLPAMAAAYTLQLATTQSCRMHYRKSSLRGWCGWCLTKQHAGCQHCSDCVISTTINRMHSACTWLVLQYPTC